MKAYINRRNAGPKRGCTVYYALNYDPSAIINNGSCVFTDNSDKLMVLEGSEELIEEHGIYVKAGVIEGYGSDVSSLVPVFGNGIVLGLPIARDEQYQGVVYSAVGAAEIKDNFEDIYPEVQGFVPLGSNSFVEIEDMDSIPVMVIAGAGVTENITAYGMALEFWDNETIGSPLVQSSLSNGVICGKIWKIKNTLNCSWWEARYRARITADRNESRRPTNTLWTKEDGFGKVNVSAAIAFAGSIPVDPYLNAGNTYAPFVPTP